MSRNSNSSRSGRRDVTQNAAPLISPVLESACMLKLYKDNKIISRVQHFMVSFQLPSELHILHEMPVLQTEEIANMPMKFPQFYICVASEDQHQVMEWQKFVSYLFHRRNRVAICEWAGHHLFILPPPDVDCRCLSVVYRPISSCRHIIGAANPHPPWQPPPQEWRPPTDWMPSYGDGDGSERQSPGELQAPASESHTTDELMSVYGDGSAGFDGSSGEGSCVGIHSPLCGVGFDCWSSRGEQSEDEQSSKRNR